MATIDSNYHVFFNSSTISIASGSTNLILKDGTLAAYTTKTLTVTTGNTINTIASPVIFTEATTSIQFTIAGPTTQVVTITKADGSALGTATYSSGTTYVWTNATGGSVGLAKTDPIWLKVVDSTTLYPSYFYKVLVYTGETNWLAWRDQTVAVTLIQNTIVKVRV